MNELIKEAYIQSQCQVLSCSKTQYLHDIAIAQIDHTKSFLFIFGILTFIGTLIFLLSIYFYKKKDPDVALPLSFCGVFAIMIMGLCFLINLYQYMTFVDNPNMAILHWIDNHIAIANN